MRGGKGSCPAAKDALRAPGSVPWPQHRLGKGLLKEQAHEPSGKNGELSQSRAGAGPLA